MQSLPIVIVHAIGSYLDWCDLFAISHTGSSMWRTHTKGALKRSLGQVVHRSNQRPPSAVIYDSKEEDDEDVDRDQLRNTLLLVLNHRVCVDCGTEKKTTTKTQTPCCTSCGLKLLRRHISRTEALKVVSESVLKFLPKEPRFSTSRYLAQHVVGAAIMIYGPQRYHTPKKKTKCLRAFLNIPDHKKILNVCINKNFGSIPVAKWLKMWYKKGQMARAFGMKAESAEVEWIVTCTPYIHNWTAMLNYLETRFPMGEPTTWRDKWPWNKASDKMLSNIDKRLSQRVSRRKYRNKRKADALDDVTTLDTPTLSNVIRERARFYYKT